ncbi:MAG: hypothetical protein MUF48_21210 [Pirellulaceae bacterium]|nr:hypothetical protein [Pirellulaceae bacterium]
MNRTKRRRVITLVVAPVAVCLALLVTVLAALYADDSRYTYVTPGLVGVWAGETGNAFALYADGTGCGRASDERHKPVFFRWNEREGHLTTFIEPARKPLLWKVEQMLRGLPTCAMSSFAIQHVDQDVLVLSTESGHPIAFTRADHDPAVLAYLRPGKVQE